MAKKSDKRKGAHSGNIVLPNAVDNRAIQESFKVLQHKIYEVESLVFRNMQDIDYIKRVISRTVDKAVLDNVEKEINSASEFFKKWAAILKKSENLYVSMMHSKPIQNMEDQLSEVWEKGFESLCSDIHTHNKEFVGKINPVDLVFGWSTFFHRDKAINVLKVAFPDQELDFDSLIPDRTRKIENPEFASVAQPPTSTQDGAENSEIQGG